MVFYVYHLINLTCTDKLKNKMKHQFIRDFIVQGNIKQRINLRREIVNLHTRDTTLVWVLENV